MNAKLEECLRGNPRQSVNKSGPEVSNLHSPKLVYNDQYGEPDYKNSQQPVVPESAGGYLASATGFIQYDGGRDGGTVPSKRFVQRDDLGPKGLAEEAVKAIKALEKWADKNNRILNEDSYRRTVLAASNERVKKYLI